jgi:uncharacterized protein with HEPN domain
MKDETLKHLFDIKEAASAILSFVKNKTFDDYNRDELLRSGVERKFEIIGEALGRIKRTDPAVINKIGEYRSVVSFRNILAHGYDSIDHRIVWQIIQDDLVKLFEDVKKLMGKKA